MSALFLTRFATRFINSIHYRDERKSFIRAKYEERRFVEPLCADATEVFADLEAAVDAHNIFDLLQATAEAAFHGVDITDPLPSSVSGYVYV